MLTVRYENTVQEIWRWYGRFWLKRLWPIDLGLAFMLATMTAFLSSNIRGLAYPPMFFAVLAGVALLALWPVLRPLISRPRPVTLSIDPQGVTAEPGGVRRAWREVAAVEELDGAVVLAGGNRSAFIAPARAFDSAEARDAFLAQARAWKAG